jgi:ABC-type lipoprotein export system ATPase subunit
MRLNARSRRRALRRDAVGMDDPLIVCDNLVKIYKTAELEVVALQGLDLRVAPGEMLGIVGASGSGKSTLMNILGGLDAPTAGACRVSGQDVLRLTERGRLAYRRAVVGHVWQQSGRNLVPDYTLARNVDLPQVALGAGHAARTARTRALLAAVGLADMSEHYPAQLSGGEQQRASIAVALANEPPLLLADEPTGELDSITAAAIMRLLRRLNDESRLTVVLVTHDPAVAAAMDRVISIRDGRTSTEMLRRGEPSAAGAVEERGASAIIGLPHTTHREAVVVDRAGRLQLPHAVFERLRFEGRAEVRDAGDHIEIWPFRPEES